MGGGTEQSCCVDPWQTTACCCSVGGNDTFLNQVIVSCAFAGCLKGTGQCL